MNKKSQTDTAPLTSQTQNELIQLLLKKNQENKQKELLKKLLKINSEKKAKYSNCQS
ncbi:hypothetical protein [Fluviispira sanaruensis]|uniref:Uncharacterized protein n=1 Tax=Fluviispira sanaruensis TaxID=2493639 RepID=A0A4P2VSL5_FLUSA|nr:hypothetical protein [Fluviispira sanaruensis]BBH51812.1 hypothetical protein JCM31447_02330 [Fluviispira sanaruensis]